MSFLEEAIMIAAQAHRGQRDKSGAPYILHPLRVMFNVKTEAEKVAAVLHDVVEDTEWTLDALRARGFPPEALDAVDCLTHRADEPYAALIERARANPIARRVKIADLEDNMDIRRLGTVTPRDAERLSKYYQAWLALTTDTPQAF